MDARLVMFKSNGQRKDIPLSRSTVVIGRGDDCDLRVPLAAVSRRHCELNVAKDFVLAKDLGSANGTFLNDQKLNEPAKLKAGDRLAVGPVVFTLQIDGRPKDIKPPKAAAGTKAAKGPKAPKAGQEEELVELEADVVEESDEDVLAGLKAETGEDGADPIAALEALASATEKPKDAPDAKKKKQ